MFAFYIFKFIISEVCTWVWYGDKENFAAFFRQYWQATFVHNNTNFILEQFVSVKTSFHNFFIFSTKSAGIVVKKHNHFSRCVARWEMSTGNILLTSYLGNMHELRLAWHILFVPPSKYISMSNMGLWHWCVVGSLLPRIN